MGYLISEIKVQIIKTKNSNHQLNSYVGERYNLQNQLIKIRHNDTVLNDHENNNYNNLSPVDTIANTTT